MPRWNDVLVTHVGTVPTTTFLSLPSRSLLYCSAKGIPKTISRKAETRCLPWRVRPYQSSLPYQATDACYRVDFRKAEVATYQERCSRRSQVPDCPDPPGMEREGLRLIEENSNIVKHYGNMYSVVFEVNLLENLVRNDKSPRRYRQLPLRERAS